MLLKESWWKRWKLMKAADIPKVLKTYFFKYINWSLIISSREKEKRVLEWLDQNKSYREIQDQLHISSRDISFIAKKAKAKKRQRRRKEKTDI